MKTASIQLEIKNDMSKEDMIEHAMSMLDLCKGSDLILLPELWNVAFSSFAQYHELGEPLDGMTMSAVAAKARELGAYIMGGSFVETDGDKCYNTCVLFDRNGVNIGAYRKIHLYSYHSREAQTITPGDKATVVDTEFGRVGLATCYDLRFPEQFRKMTIELGAEIFLIAAAWPFPRLEVWNTLNQARALENVCYLISSNSVGTSRSVRLAGHSQIVDPWGNVLAGSGYEETIVRAEISRENVSRIREAFPVLKDVKL